MQPRERVRFATQLPAAFHADLFGMLFGMWEPPPPYTVMGDFAVVDIRGPMMQREDWRFDSYDSIEARFDAAITSDKPRVMLRIDSPGGVVSGCFELARSMRSKAEASGKELVAFGTGMVCSGGYALATAASRIYAQPSATIGSVGVLLAILDASVQDAMFGEKWALFTSGEEKADGNPHVPVSTEAASRAQAQVNELAVMFFELVAEHRGLSVDAIAGLQAGAFFGPKALGFGLIDQLATLDEVLAMPAGGKRTQGESPMAWKEDMRKAAKEGDADAVKALSALDEGNDEEKEKKRKEEEAARSGEDPPKEETADGGDPAEDSSKKAARRATMPVAARLAYLEEQEDKRALLASRADLPAAKKAELLGQPLSVVRWAVKELPRVVRAPAAAPVVVAPAATSTTLPSAHAASLTPGVMPHGGGTSAPTGTPSELADEAHLDRQMGLNRNIHSGVRHTGNVISFGPMSPEAAKARLAEIEAEEAKQAAEARKPRIA